MGVRIVQLTGEIYGIIIYKRKKKGREREREREREERALPTVFFVWSTFVFYGAKMVRLAKV